MRIAVIGAGFTGLTAGYYLKKQGHDVHIFEQDTHVGGLASGMRDSVSNFPSSWEWDLEKYYHHWFTNDTFVFELGREIGVSNKFITKRPVSSILFENNIYPFDSPINLLKFPHLSIKDRLKTGILMARLKYQYNESSSEVFENITAHDYLSHHSSQAAYKKIWEPLLKGKYGTHYKKVNMRWFWARVFKRTPSLRYYNGGFSSFAHDIATAFTNAHGFLYLETPVECIRQEQMGVSVISEQALDPVFDKVIATTAPHIFFKQAEQLPETYKNMLSNLTAIGAYTLVLSLKHKLLTDDTYWLNVNDENWPFLAVVEHTNFQDKSHYNNEHVVYIGDYVNPTDPILSQSPEQLVEKFTPYLNKINPLFSAESINHSFLFSTPYAQPIFEVGYGKNIPPIQTPLENVLFASMSQVYPWDRGTNYAIELGKKCVDILSSE
ncbi:NAD(P)-binding protein [bacterium]|nr:NAD(P)-binding protein [bacterium]